MASCSYGGSKELIAWVKQGDIESARTLLHRRFVHLEAVDNEGNTPLLIAGVQHDWELFDLLLAHGANINALNARDRDLLNTAVKIQSPSLGLKAIDAGIYVNRFTPSYQGSALIYASAEGQVEIVNALIAAGALVDRQNNLGWTALLEAVVLGDGSEPYQTIVKALLQAGADKNIKDKFGRTALYHADAQGYEKISHLLQHCDHFVCSSY
ncbi:ankyrin repeat domain-containing protein [Eionea flava]